MATGMLYIWASAVASLFGIYVVFTMFVPVTALLDNITLNLLIKFGVTENQFGQLYYRWIPILVNWMGYLTVGGLIATILWLILQPTRKSTTDIVTGE